MSTLLLVLAPVACRKESGPPSQDYEQAHTRFSKLYGQKLDEAFLEPEMAEIEAQLQLVPPDSMDAQSARELSQRIQQGRARMEAAQQEKEDAIASAREFDTFPSTGTGSGSTGTEPAAPAEPVPAPAARDAGTPDAGAASVGPTIGSPASELSSGYSRCFQRGQPINVEGRGSRETWEMIDRLACRQSFPRFVDQVVLVEEGKVLTVLPKSAIQITYSGKDGGAAPAR
ncbi:hypothetical protein [Hyalangium rubrum]|uniref:Lipoprotein n=1 Tax=Hyalangium rubrum TaxID=3103134 RepID=A0ABU5HJ18_9BACT|nr:hypothetical protein [Hyalangium sp. s54d21]MDY7232874.1 hypothetical protein [Hyalangium sp. s54d21]